MFVAPDSTAPHKPSPELSSGGSLPEQPTKWFAAYTTPRHEKVVARHLQSRHIEAFLPLYSSVRRWKNGCRVAVEQPLFPSYLFVHIPRREAVKVLQIPGVVSLVSAGREPAALPSAEIESLRSSLPLRHFEPHPYLVVGEKVRITAGSLEGMVGVLIRRKNDCRVVLTLELIMQSVAVEIGIDEIEPVKQ
ncbi:MAG: UpxY family transcription antiterminator [Candidatus Korobacteraceae bacterium]